MNWGDIQIESLKKMFLNNDVISKENLNEYKGDKKYRTYLAAMPQVANEAIHYIIEKGKPYIKELKILIDNPKDPIDLMKLAPDFKCISEIVCQRRPVLDYRIIGNNILLLNEDYKEVFVYYEAYPEMITSTTLADQLIPLDRQFVSLIPLYIAGELYKDDDISLSTMYMNEFLSNMEYLSTRNCGYSPSSVTTVYRM